EPEELAVLVGQRDDHVLEPLGPARIRLVRADLRERGRDVGLALGVGHDRLVTAKEAVVPEAGVLDRLDEFGPDLVVTLLVLRFLAGIDLEREADPFHRPPRWSKSVPVSVFLA